MNQWEQDRNSAINELINRTIVAIRQITIPRYHNTERGFAAEFYCYIKQQLDNTNIFPEHTIPEMEVQKRHDDHYGVIQRPDILIHIPIETALTENANENNFVVYAFKLNGYRGSVAADFNNLDEMFEYLNYDIGLFINIRAYPRSYLQIYEGNYRDKIHELSIRLHEGQILINHSYFENDLPVMIER